MEVPLSSPEGLYLRDVIDRLNLLRGNGMACKYSWSSKRSYKNGFVWHDLSENDFIYPAHGHEYVLKGSELLLDDAFNPNALAIASSRSLIPPPETQNSGDNSDFPVVVRRRNQSWSSIDLQEYKVYKTESVGDSAGKAAADASTQTDDKRRRRRALREEKEERQQEVQEERVQSTELSGDEISPPPLDSSPETIESLLKADGRLVLRAADGGNEAGANRTAEICTSGGRMKASSVLMQLLSCGTISFKDCGATYVKDQGLSLIGQSKARLARGDGAGNQEGALAENLSLQRVKLEDKEYFSGSLIETKKEEVPALKRSSSYNADSLLSPSLSDKILILLVTLLRLPWNLMEDSPIVGPQEIKEILQLREFNSRKSQSSRLSSKLQFAEEEVGVRAKCIPRKPKALPTKKESNIIISSCNSHGGSKRFEVQHQM
ncbi:hypothetical protein FEM48_Zijuj02G0081600 [Ziziphus jujuba var. spinosa]|uniref:SOSEKI DIX-like domain-containing protein n=1 Tax=Ziziphus jujuba var. spinosa TaxID=714518 RepID=A0A978VUL5_ZIZJJ|nr:hypothetical protein FEM48_Zijuj02G0081600 [Ziziphus jujuba var. spinosa]